MRIAVVGGTGVVDPDCCSGKRRQEPGEGVAPGALCPPGDRTGGRGAFAGHLTAVRP